ncbi:MAG: serine hydrolase [Pirellulales bacterium]
MRKYTRLNLFSILVVVFVFPAWLSAQESEQNGKGILSAEALLESLDKDKDGKLSRAEVPQRMSRLFTRVDKNNDQVITLEELSKTFAGSKISINRDKPKGDDANSPAIENDERYQKSADYLKSRNGHAMLVFENNNLVFEQYFNGHSKSDPHRLASGTKSFSGAMLVAAVEDGLLTLDEPVAKTIVEWKDDKQKSIITIRQLLALRSGIHGGTIGKVPSYADAIKQAQVTATPGTKFQYGPVPYQVFGELMRRKLEPKNESVEQYLKRRVLDPIGLKPSYWLLDDQNNIQLPSGVMLTASEWAKYGLLITNLGKHEGKQVLPANLLKQCFLSNKVNPRYGVTFWLDPRAPKSDPLILAAGAGKQKLYIFPMQNRLIVQFAESLLFRETEFLKLLP